MVDDSVSWTWTGVDAVLQVADSGSLTPVSGGISSGKSVLNGNFTHQFKTPGIYYFRTASKGYPLRVEVLTTSIGAGAPNILVGQSEME